MMMMHRACLTRAIPVTCSGAVKRATTAATKPGGFVHDEMFRPRRRTTTTLAPVADATPARSASQIAAGPNSNSKLKVAALATVALAAVLLLPSAAHAAAAVSAPEPTSLASLAKSTISFLLHLDVHLGDIIAKYGMTTYGILFAIVFAETGLVVTPLLPG
jgi:hypothetical protein